MELAKNMTDTTQAHESQEEWERNMQLLNLNFAKITDKADFTDKHTADIRNVSTILNCSWNRLDRSFVGSVSLLARSFDLIHTVHVPVVPTLYVRT